MKKKMMFLVAVLILGMLLCSCSGGTQEKMFGVKLPSGEKLTLYMSRDKAEELMVEYESEYEDMIGWYDYGFITLGYTEGLLSYISFKDPSDVTLLNGLGIGDTDYEKYGFELDGQHVNTDIFYQKVDGKYERIDTYDKDMEYQDGIDVGIVVSKDNNEVQHITIADVHSVLMRDYEE